MKEVKKLFSIFSKPVTLIVSVAFTIFGINVLVVFADLAIISANTSFFEKNSDFILGSLIIMIFSIIVCLLLICICLCVELLRTSFFSECFDENFNLKEIGHLENCIDLFSQNLSKLNISITGLVIAGNIIDKNTLMDIERNVPARSEIIILSSKYILDEEYKSLIINNIKKGVTYKYIVSGAKKSSVNHMRFKQIVDSWHTDYIALLKNDNKTLQQKRPKVSLTTKRINNADIDKYFYNHVKEYNSPFEYTTLTVMLYQDGPGKEYRVIVNLPVEQEGYYSYVLPPKHTETKDICNGILSICKIENECNYKGERL